MKLHHEVTKVGADLTNEVMDAQRNGRVFLSEFDSDSQFFHIWYAGFEPQSLDHDHAE